MMISAKENMKMDMQKRTEHALFTEGKAQFDRWSWKEDRDWLKNQGSILMTLFRQYSLPEVECSLPEADYMKSDLSSEGDGELGSLSISKREDISTCLVY